jgi:hypothetical protein
VDGANDKQVDGDGMKPRAITREMLEAATRVVQVIRYKAEGTPIPADYDAEGKARLILDAPDCPEKREFLRMVRKFAKSAAAEKAAEAAGLYSTSGLYAVLCDPSEHIMHGQGKTKYQMPDICVTSDEARRSATDIVTAIKRVTGFDLMDPASLRRMRKKVTA